MFEIALREANERLASACKDSVLKGYALIGSFAVSRWGVARATQDIDFIISLGDSSLERVAEQLGGVCMRGELQDPLMGVVSFSIADELSSIPIQLIQFPPTWEDIAFDQAEKLKLAATVLPIVHWRALVLLKLYAGEPLDLQDAANILAVQQPKKKDLEYLTTKANSLRVSRRLERLLKDHRGPSTQSGRKKKKMP